MVTSTPLVAAAATKVLSGTTSLIHWLLACAEAPALEEALRNAGFGSETKTMQNPAFDEHTCDKQGKHGAKSALGALQIHVRPRRSSFKVLSSAGKDVQHSIFVSAKKTAGLTVGLVSHNNKICVSCSSIPGVAWLCSMHQYQPEMFANCHTCAETLQNCNRRCALAAGLKQIPQSNVNLCYAYDTIWRTGCTTTP